MDRKKKIREEDLTPEQLEMLEALRDKPMEEFLLEAERKIMENSAKSPWTPAELTAFAVTAALLMEIHTKRVIELENRVDTLTNFITALTGRGPVN